MLSGKWQLYSKNWYAGITARRYLSAGAHLSAILCYSKKIQKAFGIDISPVTEFIGVSASYSFSEKQTLAVRLLLNQLFPKNYDRTQGEPCSPMEASAIPMLLIQSRHDVHA